MSGWGTLFIYRSKQSFGVLQLVCWLPTHLVRAQGPVLQVSGGTEEAELAAFEFEGDVLQSDEAFAGLGVGVVEIVQRGRAGIHASLDGGEILLGNFVFKLGDFVRGLHLRDGTLQA